MKGSIDFLSGFRAWLAYCWQCMAALDQDESWSERPYQSVVMVSGLQRFRQECIALQSSAETHRYLGSLKPAEYARVAALLHDLVWLLDVSPSAPPSLARQCIRIVQDRVAVDLAADVGARPVRVHLAEDSLELA